MVSSPCGDTRGDTGPSLRWLMCPAQDHFIFFTFTFILPLTQMLVFLYLYGMLSILPSILVCAAASLICACLVSVQVSAPYIIAGSTQELHPCLFRQMARLLLNNYIPVFGVCRTACHDSALFESPFATVSKIGYFRSLH